MLVLLCPSRTSTRRDHLREGEQRRLYLSAQRVALLQGDSRRAHHRDRERPFVERRKEAPAQEPQGRHCRHKEDRCRAEYCPRMRQCSLQILSIALLDFSLEPRLRTLQDPSTSQQQITKNRRNCQRDQKRRAKGDHIGKTKRPKQSAVSQMGPTKSSRSSLLPVRNRAGGTTRWANRQLDGPV